MGAARRKLDGAALAEWNAKHPRGPDGKFLKGGGSTAAPAGVARQRLGRKPNRPSRRPAEVAAEPASVTLDGIDLRAISEDDLYGHFAKASAAQHVDDSVLQRLADEMQRREDLAAPPRPEDAWLSSSPSNERFDWLTPDEVTPQQQRLEDLLGRGVEFREAYAQAYSTDETTIARQEAASLLDRRAGETLPQAVRRAYDEWVNLEYLKAEGASSGFLLNRVGLAAGIDPRTLWSGNLARARKYASEELLRWWTTNARLDLTQFRADILKREADIQAARTTRQQSNDQDFI